MFFKYVFKNIKLMYIEYAMKIYMCNVFKNKTVKKNVDHWGAGWRCAYSALHIFFLNRYKITQYIHFN